MLVLVLLPLLLPSRTAPFPSLKIKGKSLESSPSWSSTVAIRMQEHLSRDAKKALATPLMIHMATPSALPHPGPGEDRAAALPSVAPRLKKVAQLEEVVVAAMNWGRRKKSFQV